ncbi:MAG: DUF4291 domain-containing protein [Gemmataceae bacterium]|nr:DUF4291 domain-containing protein [Gemmataceae bacterium]
MPLAFKPHAEQVKLWPKVGRHILAQFDDESVIVYQAYNVAIGRYAVEHGAFGGDFSFDRMSWIKPNFLWMSAVEARSAPHAARASLHAVRPDNQNAIATCERRSRWG